MEKVIENFDNQIIEQSEEKMEKFREEIRRRRRKEEDDMNQGKITSTHFMKTANEEEVNENELTFEDGAMFDIFNKFNNKEISADKFNEEFQNYKSNFFKDEGLGYKMIAQLLVPIKHYTYDNDVRNKIIEYKAELLKVKFPELTKENKEIFDVFEKFEKNEISREELKEKFEKYKEELSKKDLQNQDKDLAPRLII